MSASTVALVFGIGAALVIAHQLRSRRMREKYAITWSFVAIAVLLLAIFPGTLEWAAERLGVAVPVNLLYFLGGIAALLMSVQFSVSLSLLEERTRTLAEEVALLETTLRDLSSAPPASGDGEEPDPGSAQRQ